MEKINKYNKEKGRGGKRERRNEESKLNEMKDRTQKERVIGSRGKEKSRKKRKY